MNTQAMQTKLKAIETTGTLAGAGRSEDLEFDVWCEEISKLDARYCVENYLI